MTQLAGSIRRRLRAVASLGLLAAVTNCLVASDGRDAPPIMTGSGGAGGSTSITSSSSSATTGSAGGPINGGAGGGASSCSGPTPNGARECGPGRNCIMDCTSLKSSCAPAGTGIEGSRCVTVADCGPGFDCVQYSDTQSFCNTLCVVDADCPTGFTCTGSLLCSAGGPQTATVCDQPCQDVTAGSHSSCGPGFKCGLACNAGRATLRCSPVGALRSGPCSSDVECADGFSCVGHACVQACVTNADCTMGDAYVKEAFCGSTASGFHFCG